MNNLQEKFEHMISTSVASDKNTSEFVAWVFPIGMIVPFLLGAPTTITLINCIFLLFIVLAVIGLQYEFVLRLADEVIATETHLNVKRGSEMVRIPYDAIRTVSYVTGGRAPARMTMHLFDTKIFGGRVSFKPEEQFKLTWPQHPITNNLLNLLNSHND